ncbi:uncharacterized protein TNCV_3524141 [Trichonephila clavipes]|uniref:Uncharacterized protein n=1 Tax=Trichonephila clavipes TaxID=2585209 RepID=A0A8X6SGI2_TRICX|nr:uncharacterized protein TNCV_3524141 [Trichonephila clavipes]
MRRKRLSISDINNEILHHWNRRIGANDLKLFPRPLRSPDLTPYDFFQSACVKDLIYVPLLPQSLVKLKEQISATVDKSMLQNVWKEFHYRLDMCR